MQRWGERAKSSLMMGGGSAVGVYSYFFYLSTIYHTLRPSLTIYTNLISPES